MYYHGNNDWRDYLAHYGVKGMKKGKHLPGTSWWKELTGSKYSDEAKRQDEIQKKERMLGNAASERWAQAYNPGGTDKDAIRGLKYEKEWSEHRRKEEEAFDKEMQAKRDYKKNNLSAKVNRATNPLKAAWKTKVTGEAYKREASKNVDNAKRAQWWADGSGSSVVNRNNAFNRKRNAHISSERNVNKASQKEAEKSFNDEYKKSYGSDYDTTWHTKNAKKEAKRARDYLKTANANQRSYYEKSLKGKAENFIKKKFGKKRYYDRSDLY